MAYVISSRDQHGSTTRQKYTNLKHAIEKFERLFGGKFEAAIAAYFEGHTIPSRDIVHRVEATSEAGTRVVFAVR